MLHQALRLQATIPRQFTTSAARRKSFNFKFVLPEERHDIQIIKFESVKVFNDTFCGFYFTDPNTRTTYSYKAIPKIVDPEVVYIAGHPFLLKPLKDSSRWHCKHTTDKAFVDSEKACQALEHHLKHIGIIRRAPQDASRSDGWCTLAADKHDVAEWECIWESGDGHFYFLDANYFVDAKKLLTVKAKLKRSVEFLRVDVSKATVYVVGNCWQDDAVKDLARTELGFGVLACNGHDLDVLEPMTS